MSHLRQTIPGEVQQSASELPCPLQGSSPEAAAVYVSRVWEAVPTQVQFKGSHREEVLSLSQEERASSGVPGEGGPEGTGEYSRPNLNKIADKILSQLNETGS